MNWLSVVAILVFLIGLGAGGFIVARSPSFWIGFATELARKLLPIIIAFVLKRKTPEEEKKWRDEYLRGTKDRKSNQ